MATRRDIPVIVGLAALVVILGGSCWQEALGIPPDCPSCTFWNGSACVPVGDCLNDYYCTGCQSCQDCTCKPDNDKCEDCYKCVGTECQWACESGEICCGTSEKVCCPSARCCNNVCCSQGEVCCNGACCPSSKCCNGTCCGTNQACFEGKCYDILGPCSDEIENVHDCHLNISCGCDPVFGACSDKVRIMPGTPNKLTTGSGPGKTIKVGSVLCRYEARCIQAGVHIFEVCYTLSSFHPQGYCMAAPWLYCQDCTEAIYADPIYKDDYRCVFEQ